MEDNIFADVSLPTDVKNEQVVTVRAELAPLIELARSVVVTDETTYKAAVELSQECARRAKKVESEFSEAREKTHAAWKSVTTLIASFVDPLKKARELIDTKTMKWYREEKDRKAIAEMKRVEDERKRLEEERLKNAVALEAAGKKEIAEELFKEEVIVAPVKIEKTVVEGSGYRENWQAEVVDFMALVKAVADGKAPLAFLSANESALRAQAKSLKAACSIPGVKVYDAGSMVHRK